MKPIAQLRRFACAKKGLAALEFALIAPMMILLLFGSVDLIHVLGVNQRAQNTAASLADVVARDDAVTDQEITGLWAAIGVLMFPDDGANLDIRVTSVSIENATTARVMWSEGNGMSALVAGDTIDLPDQMMETGSSVIFAESTYEYHSPLGFLLAGPVMLRHQAYRRSRLVDPIPRVA